MNVRERSREVAKSLKRYVIGRISSGQLLPGDKLPTERELVEMFGGGRSTVRKALQDLEQEGLLAREVGRGTFVREDAVTARGSVPGAAVLGANGLAGMQPLSRVASPADVMELRLMIEPAVVEQAVTRASQAEIDAMYEYLDHARTARTLEEFEHWDDVLHRSIAAASRNPLCAAVYGIISEVRREAQWGDLKRRTLTDELKRKHMEEHVRIVDAIRSRDPAAARAEMLHHLTHIRNNMFGM